MRKRDRQLLLAACAALLLTLGLVVTAGLTLPAGPARRLPDGTRVTLVGMTAGLPRTVRFGRPLQTWLHTWLPPALGHHLGVTAIDFGGAPAWPDQQIAWLHITPAASQLPVRAALVDEHGCEVGSSYDFPFRPDSGEGLIWRLNFPAHPRRGRSLRLRLVGVESGGTVEFPLPEVEGGPYPQWTPQPLPLTRHDGDVAVTLTDFRTGIAVDPTRSYGETRVSRMLFRLKRKGRPSEGWLPDHVLVADATGNRWVPGGRASTEPRGDLLWTMYTDFWPDEHAWKLKAEFVRKHSFDPDELWTLRGVTPSRAVDVAGNGPTFAKEGGLVRFLGLRGSRVWVRYEKRVPGLRVTLVRAVDERGRPVRRRVAFSDGNPYVAELALGGARSLDLTFAVYRSRTVEFTAAPSRGR
jgi:hypothetical protein